MMINTKKVQITALSSKFCWLDFCTQTLSIFYKKPFFPHRPHGRDASRNDEKISLNGLSTIHLAHHHAYSICEPSPCETAYSV